MESQKEFIRSPQFVAKSLLLSISSIAGFIGFGFCVWKDNYFGAISFITLVFVTVLLLRLYWNQMKGEVFATYSRGNLYCLVIMGCFMFVVTFIFSIFLIIYGVKVETEFNFVYNNAYFALLPSLASNVWTVVLAYEARKLEKLHPEPDDSSNTQGNAVI